MEEINSKLDLEITREIDAPAALIWKAWTNPEHLKKWWAPRPVETVECVMDVRPGGRFYTKMRMPDGQEFPGDGCFLEVVENRRLVWTDALGPGYRPNAEPFMTAILELEDLGKGRTRYRARAIHHSEEIRKKHEEMGFYDGWGAALDQLVALLPALK